MQRSGILERPNRGLLRARIGAWRGSLIPSERRVADAILASPAEIVAGSVGQLAAHASVSVSTVVRACQHLGFAGFQELRLALAGELGADPPWLGPPREDHEDVLEAVLLASARRVEEVRALLDPGSFERAVDSLVDAQRVLCLGHSTSAATAADAAYCLGLVGRETAAPIDLESQQLSAARLHVGEVCLCISHSGATRPMLDLVQRASRTEACTIAIVSVAGSPLHRLVDVALIAGAMGSGFPLEAMASRVAHQIVIDALYVAVAERTRPASTEALDQAAAITAQSSVKQPRRVATGGRIKRGYQ